MKADVYGGIERDSRKDEAVVFIFIFATAGLLIWAAIKPWVGKWIDVSIFPCPSRVLLFFQRFTWDECMGEWLM